MMGSVSKGKGGINISEEKHIVVRICKKGKGLENWETLCLGTNELIFPERKRIREMGGKKTK